MQRAYLRINSADGPQKVVVGDSPVTIGRHPDNIVVLTDVQASRFHCIIQRTRDGGFAVQDLNSRNGTKINGELVKSAMIQRDDVICIGNTEMTLVFMGSAEANAASPAAKGAASAAKPGAIPPPPVAAAGAPTAPPAAPARARPPHKKAPVSPPAPEFPAATASIEPPPLELPPIPKSASAASGHRMPGANEADVPPPIDASDDAIIDLSAASGQQDDERYLPVMAESLPNKQFPAEEIGLLNARSQVVHPTASSGVVKSSAPSDTVNILRQTLLICCRARATDIHVEPKAEDFQLRLRIDGTMVDIVHLTKAAGIRLCALVKVLSDIDVQYKTIIQEGHFSATVPGRRIDFRVSFAPAMFGQKLVVRVLDTANVPLHLPDLKLPLWMMEEIQRVYKADSGMILACGPTGSGKTTTLYATLRGVGTEKRNVVTIEDPVEIEIPGTTQIPVNDEQGNSFSNLLRSLLRQDPDVMMVGEVRDQETARIAMQAAMTGHLVLTTVHAKDTIGALFRMLDLGVEPYTAASGLQLILSQRLVRELCPHCKKPRRPTDAQKQRMGKIAERVQEIYVPAGCPKCLKTGFSGRRAFFEMLLVNEEIRDIILKSPSPHDIEAAVSKTKFPRLMDAGYQLVIRGLTAFDEIEKVVGR